MEGESTERNQSGQPGDDHQVAGPSRQPEDVGEVQGTPTVVAEKRKKKRCCRHRRSKKLDSSSSSSSSSSEDSTSDSEGADEYSKELKKKITKLVKKNKFKKIMWLLDADRRLGYCHRHRGHGHRGGFNEMRRGGFSGSFQRQRPGFSGASAAEESAEELTEGNCGGHAHGHGHHKKQHKHRHHRQHGHDFPGFDFLRGFGYPDARSLFTQRGGFSGIGERGGFGGGREFGHHGRGHLHGWQDPFCRFAHR